MRQAFAHQARVRLLEGGDERAPGAAVTVALCGYWEHEPPCRVPHRTDAASSDDDLVVRVLFACDPGDEVDVRTRVEEALAAGELPVPAPNSTRHPRAGGCSPPLRASSLDADDAVAARFVDAPRTRS